MNKQERHNHLQFIRRNLDFLLAQAWQGYQQLGRGAVLVDADQAVERPEQPTGTAPRASTSRPNCWATAGLDWPHLAIKRLVRTYDPLREIVVAILGGGDWRLLSLRCGLQFAGPGFRAPSVRRCRSRC